MLQSNRRGIILLACHRTVDMVKGAQGRKR